jgi:hypothetical protein
MYQHLQLQDPPKFTQIGNFLFETMPSGNPDAERSGTFEMIPVPKYHPRFSSLEMLFDI